METSYYKSPIGHLEIICEESELVSLKLVDEVEMPCSESFFIKNVKSQLDEYFSGQRKIFDIKIKPKGTNFQMRVWNELIKIHYGETKSYSEIADACRNRNAQRAVGNACNKNPIIIIIPCHRVIPKNGKLGGFAYGDFIKQKLLKIEKSTNNVSK